MSIGWERWANSKRYTVLCHFQKNNLTWREAFYETAKDLRTRTNKNLVLEISGGADSMLMYNVFKNLNLEFKTVHQRYWTKDPFPLMKDWKIPGLINEYESRHVDPDIVDIYQDIDIEDFRKDKWVEKTFNVYNPAPYFAALQSYVRFVLDPEHDFIVTAADIIGHDVPGTGINPETNSMHINPSMGSNMLQVGYDGFDHTYFLDDNATILYCRWRNTPEAVLSAGTKQPFLEYHFPEYNHLPKFQQKSWPYFIDLMSKNAENQHLNWVSFITQFNPVEDIHSLDQFYDYVDNGYPLCARNKWNNPLNIKWLSDKTRYDKSTTIPSKNL